MKEKLTKQAKQVYCHKNKVVSSESEGRKSGMKGVSGETGIYLDFSGAYWTDAEAETIVLWPPHAKS